MASFDLLLREVVPDGFVLELFLSLVLQTLVLIPLVAVAVLTLGRFSASAKHLVWLLLLLAMFVSPIVSACCHGRTQFSILEPVELSTEDSRVGAALAQQTIIVEPLVQQLQLRGQVPESVYTVSNVGPTQNQPAVSAEKLTVATKTPTVESAVRLHLDSSSVSAIRRTELLLSGIWLVGILTLSIRVFTNQLSMSRTLERSLPVTDERILNIASEAMLDIAGGTKVGLFEHSEMKMPMTCGV